MVAPIFPKMVYDPLEFFHSGAKCFRRVRRERRSVAWRFVHICWCQVSAEQNVVWGQNIVDYVVSDVRQWFRVQNELVQSRGGRTTVH